MDVRTTLVVVTPAPSQDLVTLEDARSELGIKNRQQDARIKRYISQASAAIARYTERVWRQETVTEAFFLGYGTRGSACWGNHLGWPHRHHSDGSQVPLVLKRFPSIAVTQLTVGGIAVDPETYRVDPDKGLLWRDWEVEDTSEATWGMGRTVVDYTGGYATIEDVPPDVQQACFTQIRRLFYAGNRDPTVRSIDVDGVQAETYWVGAIGENGAILPEAASLLAPYMDMRRYQ